MSEADTGGGTAAALGAADWLCLAAAPTFAIMALLTGVLGGGPPDMLCSAAQDASAAERNGPDVRADERLPFGALAEADLQPTKRCPPVLIRRSPDRGAEPSPPVNTLRGDEQCCLVGVRGSGGNSTGSAG